MEKVIHFPYQDPILSIENRVEDLLARMSVKDKAGLMFHSMAVRGDLDEPTPALAIGSLREMIGDLQINHYNIVSDIGCPKDFVEWVNHAQALAAQTPWGIPLSISSDPRHFMASAGSVLLEVTPFTRWPQPPGIAALGDEETLRRFAQTVREELYAAGIRVALEPQLDIASEPRSPRCSGMFGESPDQVTRFGEIYVEELQRDSEGRLRISAMAKHFPGGGPQHRGEDPHFSYGSEQVYPGGQFETHLRPFVAAIGKGVRQMMPSYSKPIGTEYPEVGMAYNRKILTGLLRERLGFDGVICGDWGLLTPKVLFGTTVMPSAWGLESFDVEGRALIAIDAGVDQFGGEQCPEVIIRLVNQGRVSEKRLDESARRLLREKFLLGLFDSPYSDPEHATKVIGSSQFLQWGQQALAESVTLLDNRSHLLPLNKRYKVYGEGISHEALATHYQPVSSLGEADVAILRLAAPYESRGQGMEPFFHAGSLEFPPEQIARVKEICGQLPTIVDVYLDRPAILTPLVPFISALTVSFGVPDTSYVEALSGAIPPRGKLPFTLARSQADIEASPEDVAFDITNPLFPYGFGLSY